MLKVLLKCFVEWVVVPVLNHLSKVNSQNFTDAVVENKTSGVTERRIREKVEEMMDSTLQKEVARLRVIVEQYTLHFEEQKRKYEEQSRAYLSLEQEVTSLKTQIQLLIKRDSLPRTKKYQTEKEEFDL